jgi:hypothetical protein
VVILTFAKLRPCVGPDHGSAALMRRVGRRCHPLSSNASTIARRDDIASGGIRSFAEIAEREGKLERHIRRLRPLRAPPPATTVPPAWRPRAGRSGPRCGAARRTTTRVCSRRRLTASSVHQEDDCSSGWRRALLASSVGMPSHLERLDPFAHTEALGTRGRAPHALAAGAACNHDDEVPRLVDNRDHSVVVALVDPHWKERPL